jgi:hypothetical protein
MLSNRVFDIKRKRNTGKFGGGNRMGIVYGVSGNKPVKLDY